MKKRYDKPIPYGWYALEYCDNLKAGDVKPLSYLDRELVMFRSESGQANVLDAYCPHLGAHLGHGGIVKGESISCPFHAWEFDGTGTVTNVPYAKKIPPKASNGPCMKGYPVVERNQMIWVWYHPYGEAPSFEVEHIEEIGDAGWTPLKTFDWRINTIIQEGGENAADIAHFITVHGVPSMPDSEVRYEGHKRITILDANSATVNDDGSVDNENFEAMHLVSQNMGPGQTLQRFTRLFDVVLMATVTPIDDQSMHLRFNFTYPKGADEMNQGLGAAIEAEIVRQVGQDIPIWEHKIYKESPILCDGDGPINQYRKWFNQFYAVPPAANQPDMIASTA